jgi:hypothetical protein
VPKDNTIDDMSDEPADHPIDGLAVEQDDDSDGARKPNRQARIAAWAVIALFVAIIPLALIGSLRDAKGDPGNLTEVTYALPQDLPPLQITDATVEWGLGDWVNSETWTATGCLTWSSRAERSASSSEMAPGSCVHPDRPPGSAARL